MSKSNTQIKRVLERLRKAPATAGDLLRDCGASQAHTRLFELRQLGYEIDSRWVLVRSPHDEHGTIRVKQFELIKEGLSL